MHDKIRIDLITGLFIEVVHPSVTGEDIIETPCPQGFYKPKWNGTAWTEGATQEYIDSVKNVVIVPTTEEKLEELAVSVSLAMEAVMLLSIE